MSISIIYTQDKSIYLPIDEHELFVYSFGFNPAGEISIYVIHIFDFFLYIRLILPRIIRVCI